MKKTTEKSKKPLFEAFAAPVTKATSSTPAFIIALLMVLIWGGTGPVFHYFEDWQMV